MQKWKGHNLGKHNDSQTHVLSLRNLERFHNNCLTIWFQCCLISATLDNNISWHEHQGGSEQSWSRNIINLKQLHFSGREKKQWTFSDRGQESSQLFLESAKKKNCWAGWSSDKKANFFSYFFFIFFWNGDRKAIFFFFFLKRWSKGQFHSSSKLLEFQRASIYVGVHQDFSLKIKHFHFQYSSNFLLYGKEFFFLWNVLFQSRRERERANSAKVVFPIILSNKENTVQVLNQGFLISTSKFHIRQEESK